MKHYKATLIVMGLLALISVYYAWQGVSTQTELPMLTAVFLLLFGLLIAILLLPARLQQYLR